MALETGKKEIKARKNIVRENYRENTTYLK